MVVQDKRRNFIVATALNYFGGSSARNELESHESELLSDFLDQAKCRTLCAVPAEANSTSSYYHDDHDDEPRVKLTSELSLNQNTLVFFKILESKVSEENFHDVVQVTSISKSSKPTNSLAEALRQVWSPALQSAGFESVSLLKKLEKELSGNGGSGGGPRSLSTLLEEENRLQERAGLTKVSSERQLLESGSMYLKNIRRELETAAAAREGLVMVQEILDSVSGHLDDLWKLRGLYNEERMKVLLDIVSDDIAQLIKLIITKIDQKDVRAKDEALSLGATICEQWLAMCTRMTGLFWPHHDSHPWRGKPYRPDKFYHFQTRLKETGEIRAQKRQLTRLLTPSERDSLEIDALFESFDNVEDILSDEDEEEWKRLKDRIYNSLSPAEERVAAKLKAQLTGAKTALGLETEFRRYSELMKRKSIQNILRAERHSLLAAYPDLIIACQSAPDTSDLLDTPEVLQNVQTARVAELRLESLMKLGQQLLSDLPGYDEVSEKLKAARDEAEKQRQELIETWVNDTRQSVLSKELSLGKENSVVELSSSKLMRVNFDPRLSTLIREARSLSSLGVELPREVKDLVERASTLTGRARALQQVANFHNTIGDRMILSQRPLMQPTAVELANAVRDQSGVLWSNPRAIDTFTNRLRDLVKKFARQNAELASKHAALRDLVCNLLKGDAINLATNQNTWKDTLRNMREIICSVEGKYGNTRAWKLHWDRQLLKALGIAYRAALPNLLKKLPEIRVELTYRDERLQWQPSFEDIRMKMYSGIRRFLVIPTNFRGVGDHEDGRFHTLVPQSAHLFGPIYKEAETLLAALESLRVKWLPLIAPAKVDIGQTLKGKQPQDWEKAFKDAKLWAQEVGKLRTNEIKVSCITVDTGTIRNDLESLSRRFWERLALDLRAEASSRLVSIVDFLSSASKKLSQRARTIEEVGEAYEAYSSIKNQSQEIAQELEDVTGLGRVLAAWTREKLDGLNNAHTAWESLKERLENYQDVMLHQLEEAKLNLRHQVLAVHDEQERWNAKWAARANIVTKDWIEMMREKWTNLTEQRDTLISDCKRLSLPVDEIFASDEKAMAQMEAELEAEELNCRFQAEFIEELDRHEEEEWSVAKRRLPKIHDWLDSWESRIQLKSQHDQESLQDESIVQRAANSFIARKISELREAVDSLNVLRSDELADEHWTELKEILELTRIKRTSDITLGDMIQKSNLVKTNTERIKEVIKRAAAESGIRQALTELEAWESYTALPLQNVKDSKNEFISIVGDYSTLLARAEELRLILDGARGAAGYERFASRAARCESAIFELEERIKILSIIQRKWIYLEPVYSSGAAPNDSGRWIRADKEFRYFMGEIARDPKVPSLKKLPFHSLANLKDLMDRCQKSLDDFLEEKRSSYPRLYFLSDEDLLELVSGKGKGLDVHLSKLYQGVGSVEKVENSITSVISPEGEKLVLPEKVSLLEKFPAWLLTLEKGIRNALQQSLNTCLLEQSPDILTYPTQILLLCERIRFTEKCEMALDDDTMGLKNLLKFLENQRERYRRLEDPNNELKSLKAKNLLLETVHHLYIVRSLMFVIGDKEKLAWNWSRQIRTYKHGGGALIKCAKAEFPYRFEYQGAAIGLVRTPLTEKCYLALTQAMKLGFGGSPTGPAGTGKTESVKALGNILGRRVLVFNCDEGMDTGSMKRILCGLAQAGAWGCFDEFNRLEESTMSAVAMLIRPLQEAIKVGAPKASLGNTEIEVDSHCCLFITMNPASNDYGGRRKLPDSLARLFRPIGMAHPNKINIVKSLLECAGFMNSSNIAIRLVETFDTAEKLLSKQPHYDWGLRALRSVLSAIPLSSGQNNDNDEISRILIGIKESTMPKLVQKDSAKFLSLLKDIFPVSNSSAEIITPDKEALRLALAEICEAKGLHDSLIHRCLQLNDQLKTRSGAAIVGPSGSGKSLIIKTLADALSKIKEPIKQFQIYPGATTKAKLLGSVDPQTREFKEGLISKIISNNSDHPLWIIFNGDVEPGWAEALNSALDDNRILTLPNGVGIKLGNETRFIFETHELFSASPATVSRLGIVYLGQITPDILLKTNLLKDTSTVSSNLIMSHMTSIIEKVLKIKKEQKSAAGLFFAAMIHFQNSQSQTSLVYDLLLSICGQIEDVSARDDLARSIYNLTEIWCPDSHNPCDVVFVKHKDALDTFTMDAIITKTDDGPVYLSGPLQRGINATIPWVISKQSVIIRGPNSCGKKSLLSALLTSIKNSSDEATLIIKGSSIYGSKDLISKLKRSCIQFDSSSGSRTYKPKNGSSLILVIEDLHLASKNLQELIRQLIQEKGFYEDDLEFAQISVSIISTGDLNTKLHPRLDSLLATHYLPEIQAKDLGAIVDLHLRESLQENDDTLVSAWITKMSPTIVEVFNEISENDDKSLSQWVPRDLITWIDSLKNYPRPNNESDLTKYLIDASRRLYRSKLLLKQQKRLETALQNRSSIKPKTDQDYYIWKGKNTGLSILSEAHWKNELEIAVTKCIREGDSMPSVISSYIPEIAAGLSWGLGCEQRGILLAGRPGAGRKTATKIVSVISSLKLVDSGPGKGKSAVKSAVQSAGIDGEPTILLLEEHHLREEDVAIIASAIISKGELPNLYSTEELNGLVSPLADLAAREEFLGGLEQFLYHRLKRYLKVVLIVDSQDLKANWLSRSNLLRHCVLTTGQNSGNEWWLMEEPLTKLAITFKAESKDEEADEQLSGTTEVVQAHLNAPAHQQVPARFLALLHKWKELRENRLEEIMVKLKSLTAGVDKLKEAGERVAKLEEDATKQRKELEIEKGRANAALEQITATMRGATGQRGEMANLKTETEKESAELAVRKKEIEQELGKVEPLVEQASQAVAGISTEALSEVRSLRAPPAPVRDVLEGVLRLMGIRDTSWNSMKTFLAKRGVKDEIRNWDARRSTPASLEAVAKLIQERPESFEERTAKRASIAAAPLAAWVQANLQYGRILQQVAPLEREQRLLAERLAAAEAQIGKLESGLSSVEGKVAQLQEQLAAHSRGAAELQVRSEATEASLATARALLGKLDVEHTDWQAQLQILTARKRSIGLEAARAASLLVYQYSWKNEAKRKEAIELLVSERDRLQWRAQGLPADTESFVGAARALRGDLVPLFIDPSGVAVSWLKAHHRGEARLEVTRPADTRFLTSIELAVRFGKALLVEEIVEELPSILLPLLGRRPLRIGDRSLQAQRGFRLFLATRQESLLSALPSEADAIIVKISLGSGSRSFAERLVEKAILQETPEVEVRRREALECEERLSGEMDAARLELLEQLGNARSQDILQEAEGGGGLLGTLELTQSKAKEIERALEQSRLELEDISRRSKDHERLAKYTAVIHKFIKSFTGLSSLYNFTADALTDIFLEVERSKNVLPKDQREEKYLEKTMIRESLHHCTRAVYRKHRLPLALHLAMSLTSIPEEQRNFLLAGENSSIAGTSNSESELPNYIPVERRPSVKALSAALPELAQKIKPSWVSNVAGVLAEEDISQFEKILIIRALHPEHLHTMLSKWAAQQLGVKNLTPPSWTLKQISEENDKRPVLLLLSPGADPEPELSSLVKNRLAPVSSFVEISLGQGHIAQAEQALEAICRDGGWILLSNLQLAISWLPRLEALLRSPCCTSEKHPTTRIWLSTEECTDFDEGLSGLCLKLAYEPPEGVKRNVKKSLQQLHQRQPAIKDPCKSLLISWLHAILQERRKFVPQGWIKAYAWSEADLEAAGELVIKEKSKGSSSSMSRKPIDEWEADRGILDVAVYGGLLQDEYDMRTLRAILRHIWSKDVFNGRRKLGGVVSVPRAASDNPTILIDKLDDTDSIQVYFGLPANAHRAWEKSAAELTLTHLTEIIRKSENRSKTSKRPASADAKAPVSRAINELRHAIDQLRLDVDSSKNPNNKYKKTEEDPLKRFFADEIDTTRQLLRLVRADLDKMRSNNDLSTPARWKAEWQSGPSEVVSFVNRLVSRYRSLLALEPGLPRTLELSWFARPDAFFAALKLYTARTSGVSFEKLRLETKWDNADSGHNQTSVQLEGLLLTGARIENGVLEEVTANASSAAMAPVCSIAYVERQLNDDDDDDSDEGREEETSRLQVPVYTDSFRSHYVCSLPVPCAKNQTDLWHQRAITFHLQSN